MILTILSINTTKTHRMTKTGYVTGEALGTS